LSLAIRPSLVLMALYVVIFGIQILLLPNLVQDHGSFTVFQGASVLLTLVIGIAASLVFLSYILNWQSFLLLDSAEEMLKRDKSILPDYMASERWWPRFRKCVFNGFKLWGSFMIVYLLLVGPVLFMGESVEEYTMYGLPVFLIAMIFLTPLVNRLLILFPMIAGDVDDSSFKKALALTKGMGWKIFFCYLGTLLLAYILMFIVMLGIMAITALAAFIMSAFSAIIMFVIAVPSMIIMLTIVASVYALIFMQLSPEYAERWAEVSGQS